MSRLIASLSGGVDSAVATKLAIDAGHDVVGVHLRLHKGSDDDPGVGCCGLDSSRDAHLIADRLGIDLYVWDFTERFERIVYEPFADTYAAGRTPNPCVRCNEHVKHHWLIERGRSLGFDGIITGHYVRVLDADGNDATGPGTGHRLARGLDTAKDQSYVLHRLSQADIDATVAPIGGMDKDAVRQIARDAELIVGDKPESMDLCFIPDNDTRGHLAGRLPQIDGDIVTEDGDVLGTHSGIWNFTIGQRRGLGLGTHDRLFVTAIDAVRNRVIVGPRDDLRVDVLELDEIVGLSDVDGPIRVQIRAHGSTVPGQVDGRQILLGQPLFGVAPGQSAVCYDEQNTVVHGGGIITSARSAEQDDRPPVAPGRISSDHQIRTSA